MTPRHYQQQLVSDARRAFATLRARGAAVPRVLLQLPTGGGKTVVIAMLAASATGRVLVLVHRRELLEQARDKLQALGLRVGIIASELDVDHDAPVLVAMVQTLTARGEVPDGVTLVLLDEAHHAPASLWADVLASVGPTLRALIGLSATPARAGGGLGASFDVVVSGPSVAELQALGDLVHVRTLRPTRRLTGPAWDPLEVLRQHGERVSCTFVGSVPESRELVARAAAQGWPLLHVDETTRERRERLAEVGTTYRGVVNQGILTEGWDCPAVSLVVLARAPGHVTPYLQMAGRGTRPAPGKADLLLVDLYGVSHDLGLVDEPREWDLSGDSGRVAAGRAPGATCKACGMAYGWQPVCPYCGHRSAPKPRPRVRWSAMSEAEREDRRAAIDPARLWKGLVGKHGRWRAVHVFRGVMQRDPTREEMSA